MALEAGWKINVGVERSNAGASARNWCTLPEKCGSLCVLVIYSPVSDRSIDRFRCMRRDWAGGSTVCRRLRMWSSMSLLCSSQKSSSAGWEQVVLLICAVLPQRRKSFTSALPILAPFAMMLASWPIQSYKWLTRRPRARASTLFAIGEGDHESSTVLSPMRRCVLIYPLHVTSVQVLFGSGIFVPGGVNIQ